MRRLKAARPAPAVAVVAATVVVLAVMAGSGLAVGILGRGGTPSQVFMRNETESHDDRICPLDRVTAQPVEFGHTDVELSEPSHILAYFTWTTAVLQSTGTELTLSLQLEGPDGGQKSADWAFHLNKGHTTQTVMWPFEHLGPGSYTVKVVAQAGRPQSDLFTDTGPTLHSCALSGFVTPVTA